MRKQFKKVALGVACAMAIAVTAPAAQTSYAGTTVYEVTLGTPERRAITEESLNVGETIDLNFYGVKDWNQNKANYKCKWTASGDAVTVSNMGVVTAVKGGTAVITLTVTDKITGVSHNIAPTTITVVAEPTATPVPTEAPKPTEAPVADTAEWETVLRELHSLETYEEREAYVAGLDASKYEVASTEDFDLINKKNSYEGFIVVRDEEGIPVYDDNTGESVKTTGTVYARLDLYAERLCEAQSENMWANTVYLMTVKNIATGETDPWGVMSNTPTWDGLDRQTYTIELIITRYRNELEGFTNGTGWPDDAILACARYYEAAPAPIKTWDTLKYYEDLTK